MSGFVAFCWKGSWVHGWFYFSPPTTHHPPPPQKNTKFEFYWFFFKRSDWFNFVDRLLGIFADQILEAYLRAGSGSKYARSFMKIIFMLFHVGKLGWSNNLGTINSLRSNKSNKGSYYGQYIMFISGHTLPLMYLFLTTHNTSLVCIFWIT